MIGADPPGEIVCVPGGWVKVAGCRRAAAGSCRPQWIRLARGRDAVRVLVVGAGVVGSVVGWQLSEAGHEVVHLVRPGRAAPLAWSGIQISCADLRLPTARAGEGGWRPSEAHYQPEFIETPPIENYDFVLAPVWPRQLAPLAQELAGYGLASGNRAGGTRGEIVFMGAWAGGADEILPFLPEERFLCAYPGVLGGERHGYRVDAVLAGGPRATVIGEVDGRITRRLERLDGLLASAGLAPVPSRRIGAVLAVQYVQQVAPLGALWSADTREGFVPWSDRGGRSRLWVRCVRAWRCAGRGGSMPRR